MVSVVMLIAGGVIAGRRSGASGPRVPGADEIVAQVPARATHAPTREAARLRETLATRPRDWALAERLARLHLDEGRRTADARHFGQAEGVLQPFCAGGAPEPEALVLRAVVHQARHRFGPALADLDRALAARPAHAQAALVRASVLTVLGRYDDARVSCAMLAAHAPPVVSVACRASIDGITGQAAAAERALTAGARDVASAAERAWVLSLLGELSLWRGDTSSAEGRFREALSADPSDRYTRVAYADLLLDTGRAAEARTLLASAAEDEAVLVRLAITDRQLGSGEADARRRTLRARFDADRRRGEPVHQREEARFALEVEQTPARALELALENWSVQHEPADARLVLEAALAASRPTAAAPVLAWLRETGFEGPRLRGLAAQLEGRR